MMSCRQEWFGCFGCLADFGKVSKDSLSRFLDSQPLECFSDLGTCLGSMLKIAVATCGVLGPRVQARSD